jgi:hypothetical protein
MDLSREQIQLLNAVGPFNHSVWSSGDIQVTSEEALTGRAELLLDIISHSVQEKFGSEVSRLSLADVGCYDGWLVHNLQSRIQFKEACGYEPRTKNIKKGKTVREILGINETCKFINTDLQGATKDQADIVTCCGLLHHLEDISGAIRALSKMTRKTLYLEFVCTHEKHITEQIEYETELKDIVYNYWPKKIGAAASKLESAYYDGSAIDLSLVSIPSINMVSAALAINGFSNIKVLLDPDKYKNLIWGEKRPAFAVVMCADRSYEHLKELDNYCSQGILDFEIQYLSTVLSGGACEQFKSETHLELVNDIAHAALNGDIESRKKLKLLMTLDEPLIGFQEEIVNSLVYSFKDKVRFEIAKYHLYNSRYTQAFDLCHMVVSALNADWRSCYRSFFLMAVISKLRHEEKDYQHYKKLCCTSNELYEANWDAMEQQILNNKAFHQETAVLSN